MIPPKDTNIYLKSELTPAGISEMGNLLRIMSYMFSMTTSYVDADNRANNRNHYLVSPKNFCDQLEAMLYSNPVMALIICKDLGLFETLSTLREINPLVPNSDDQQEGWFVSSKTEKEIQGNDDALSIWNFQKDRWTPSDMDLYINLLSIVGAQRLDYKNKVYLSIKAKETSGEYSYRCGSASFDIEGEDLELLDSLGKPVDKDGKLFTDASGDAKSFSQLEYEEKLQVEGVRLDKGLSPYDVRHVFHGRVSGVLPEDQESKLFEVVAKWKEVSTGKEGTQTGYYSFVDYILGKLEQNSDSSQGHELMMFLDEAVRTFVTYPVAEIFKLRDKLADEHFTPVLGIIDTYFIAEACCYDSKQKDLNWFSDIYERHVSKFIKGVIDGAKSGDAFKIVSAGFQEGLKFIANKLANNPTFEMQGILLRAMIKLGSVADQIDQIRPETPINPFAKTMYVKAMLEQIKPRLEAVKEVVDSSLMARLQLKTTSGSKYISQEYAMQLVAWCRYQAGMEDIEIAKKTGLPLDVIQKAHIDFLKHCNENHITEPGAIEKETITLLEKICQGPTIKSLKTLVENNLVSAGGKIAIGGLTGVASVLPFILVVGPVLQAVGYTLVAALEASTLSPIPDFQSGEIYYGGCVTWSMMNPDMNIISAILLAAGVYITDYMEFGSGAFKSVRCGVDMDWVNMILAGVQAGMITLGMGYVSEDTLADLMKPFLTVFGALAGAQYGGPLGAIIGAVGGGIVGLASCLPQLDQFYKEYIWPGAKFMIGASLMGPTGVITSAISNTIVMSALTVVEEAWINSIIGNPLFKNVLPDFSAILEYVPGFGFSDYDYFSNYITHYVFGMW